MKLNMHKLLIKEKFVICIVIKKKLFKNWWIDYLLNNHTKNLPVDNCP